MSGRADGTSGEAVWWKGERAVFAMEKQSFAAGKKATGKAC